MNKEMQKRLENLLEEKKWEQYFQADDEDVIEEQKLNVNQI